MKFMKIVLTRATAIAAFSAVALSAPLCFIALPAIAADSELEDLKQAIKALQLENKELARRLATLESGQAGGSSTSPASAGSVDPLAQRLAERVRELEIAKAANEQATRLIIQDSLAKTGSKINDAVSLSGTIEMLAARTSDFSGKSVDALKLNTAELDLEIQVNPWALGSFVVQYVDGTGLRPGSGVPSAAAVGNAVDRVNLDRAFFTLGDLQRFPIYMRLGRQSLPFGSSAGVSRADALSVDSPLTVEAFEIKKNAIGLGFGLPTPTPTRRGPPVFAPPVQPLLFSPLVNSLARGLGYRPIASRAQPHSPVPDLPTLPPFYGSVYWFESADAGAASRSFTQNVAARLGYRTGGHCGRPYSELSNFGTCPWTLDVNLDYNSSVFDSKFLGNEYSAFASQFGPIKGYSMNAKATLGRVSLIGEWSGAAERANFVDGLGNGISIQPSAWQVSMGYQFGWNPWVTNIGGQGTFAAISYSESRDLAGVTEVVGGTTGRVGSLPKQRLTMTLGEWLLDGVKLVFEYSLTKDYAPAEGGSGATGRGLSAVLTYAW
jgi:hypothetical protein